VNSAYSTARGITVARAAAQYAVKSVTLGGYYSFSQYTSDTASAFRGSERYNNGDVYVMWHVTPSVVTQLSYDYLKSVGNSSATYNQVTGVASYLFSKQTSVYAMGGWVHASGNNGSGAAQAVVGSSGINPGTNWQVIAALGVLHTF
jgi:predicted porin